MNPIIISEDFNSKQSIIIIKVHSHIKSLSQHCNITYSFAAKLKILSQWNITIKPNLLINKINTYDKKPNYNPNTSTK